jgi:hypothetical protein
MIRRMRVRLRTVLRSLVVILGASTVAIGVMLVIRQVVPQEPLRASNAEVGNYLQAVGAIYAVLLAFVVYAVWGQFNEARTQVDREANEVVDLFRTADGFPDEQRRQIQQSLARYVDAVLDEEWTAMARGDEPVFERVSLHLEAVWDGLHCFEPTSECHKGLHGEALTRYNDLSDVRTSRLTSARTRIPPGLKMLLYTGATVLVGSMYLLAIDEVVIHAIVTGAIAGAVSHILYLIADLDDAFDGDWQVSRDAFHRVQRYIARHGGAA